MKKILILFLLLNVSAYSQDVTFTISQDLKLAIMEDNYGNKPFTTDIYIKAKWMGLDTYYAPLGYEYADLLRSYNRANFGMGIYKDFGKLTIGGDINIGMIIREKQTYFPSFGVDAEISYLFGRVGLSLIAQGVHRIEIPKKTLSIFGGIKIEL